MRPARSSLNKQASRRALIKLIALSAGALACNLPNSQSTGTPAPTSAPTADSSVTNAPANTPDATLTHSATVQATAAPSQLFVIDAHADIAWNFLEFGRNPQDSAFATRANDPYADFVGQRMTGFTEWQAGRVGILFASLFIMPSDHAWRSSMTQVYASTQDANTLAMEQLGAYQELESSGGFKIIRTRADLDELVLLWSTGAPNAPIGLLISMEGADAIIQPSDVASWYNAGLRAIGPAWAQTRYAGGTGEPGPLTELGGELLDAMSPLNMILDLSHIAEDAYYQAVERYDGIIIASHANPRAYLPTDRGLSDDMILRLAAKDGVMGIVLYNRYLKPGWQIGDARVPLQTVAEAIDYVAQLTGSINHVAIGSDMDGGFGLEESPEGIDSAADVIKIADALSAYGYPDDQIAAVLYGNWLRMLHRTLP